jgi:hypothetical protein
MVKVSVIPAEAGIQAARRENREHWIPAFAGMTAGVVHLLK